MSQKLTRRAAIAATATLALTAGGAPVMAVAAADPDGELIELGRHYQLLAKTKADLEERLDALREEFDVGKPAMPEPMRMRPEDGDLGLTRYYGGMTLVPEDESTFYDSSDIRRLRYPRTREVRIPIRPSDHRPFAPGEDIGEFPRDHEILVRRVPWPEAQARADAIVAAYVQWFADCDAFADRIGLYAAQAELEALEDRLAAIRQAIAERPARDHWGIRIKARIVAEEFGQEGFLELAVAESLLADLGRLADA